MKSRNNHNEKQEKKGMMRTILDVIVNAFCNFFSSLTTPSLWIKQKNNTAKKIPVPTKTYQEIKDKKDTLKNNKQKLGDNNPQKILHSEAGTQTSCRVNKEMETLSQPKKIDMSVILEKLEKYENLKKSSNLTKNSSHLKIESSPYQSASEDKIKLENQLNQSDERVCDLDKRIKKCGEQLEKNQERLDNLEKMCNETKEGFNELREEGNKLDKELNELREEFNKRDKEHNELLEKTVKRQAQLDSIINSIKPPSDETETRRYSKNG